MKKIFMTLPLLFWGGVWMQAQELNFDYDSAGNIRRWEYCEGNCTLSKETKEAITDEAEATTTLAAQVDDRVMMYPNPVTDQLQLQWSGKFEGHISHIEIFTYLGKQLQQYTQFDQPYIIIDMATYPSGTYFVRFSFDDHSVITRKTLKH